MDGPHENSVDLYAPRSKTFSILERHVNKIGILINCEEALQLIDNINDPVTKNFVNLAFMHIVKCVHVEKVDLPTSDLDMLFLVRSLERFFGEHQVIARTLAGEKVGSWFDEPA